MREGRSGTREGCSGMREAGSESRERSSESREGGSAVLEPGRESVGSSAGLRPGGSPSNYGAQSEGSSFWCWNEVRPDFVCCRRL